MIVIYINQQERPDVLIQNGGSLEQTSEHASSSSLTVRVPVDAAPIRECDYIQIYDGDTILYAGTVLQCEQAGFPTTPPWRLYSLSLASNSDLLAGVYVDLGFPAHASINQILFGNEWTGETYDPSLPEFPGLLRTRVESEGIRIGTVDDFSSYLLEEGAYLWGRSVLDVLNELAEAAGAWWEVTPDKVFHMRYSSNRPPCSFSLNQQSDVFDLSVSQDALTFYSACRVTGGQVEVPASGGGAVTVVAEPPAGALPSSQYIVRTDEQTLTSNLGLAAIDTIVQRPASGSAVPAKIKVGLEGVHDDDPDYQALMSYGGTTIKLKDSEQSFLDPSVPGQSIVCYGVLFVTEVFARVVDKELASDLARNRGGSGIVEYAMQDESITSFSAATLAALGFLASYAKRAVQISFSTFTPCLVGSELSCDLPYYAVSGAYQITQVSTQFLLDTGGHLVAQYTVTASNIPYRDPYKALWHTSSPVTFTLESGQSPEDGYYYPNTLQLKSYVTAYQAPEVTWRMIEKRAVSWDVWEQVYPSWQMLQAATSPYTWSEIEAQYPSWEEWHQNVPDWAFLENLEEVFFTMTNCLTQAGRQALLDFLSGQPSTPVNVFGDMILNWTNVNGGTEPPATITPQDTAMLGNGGITTFYLGPDQYRGVLDSLQINVPGTQTPAFFIPLYIDHTGGIPGEPLTRPLSALTMSVRTTIE